MNVSLLDYAGDDYAGFLAEVLGVRLMRKPGLGKLGKIKSNLLHFYGFSYKVLAARLFGKKVVVSLLKKPSFFQEKALRLVSGVVVRTKYEAECLGVASKKKLVVPYAVREEYGLPAVEGAEGRSKIVLLSHDSREAEPFLRAVEILASEGKQIALLVKSDKPVENALAVKKIPFDLCDVVLCPRPLDDLEGIQKALFFGKVVVALDTCGVSEFVENHRTGFLVEPDPAKIVSAVSKALGSDKLRARFAAKNKKAAKRWSKSSIRRKYEMFYNYILEH